MVFFIKTTANRKMSLIIFKLKASLLSFFFIGVFCQEIQKEFPEKCLEDLGCYQTGYPFYDPPHRFISLLPFDKKDIDTRFLLFTPTNNNRAEVIQDSINWSAEDSFFNPDLPTKVFIPGYTSTVKQNDSNVTISGIAPKSIHLIGHSLGAHLAGWAGKQIQNLGRITGLDPAGPMFYQAPSEVRLDKKDALFVDIIHTNGGKKFEEGLGLDEAIGHWDFYPNGGKQQPGCYGNVQQELFEEDADKNVTLQGHRCSHRRAVELFIESILTEKCRFMGNACTCYANFNAKKCHGRARKAEMGLHSKMSLRSTRGQKFYLKTGETYPYCIP